MKGRSKVITSLSDLNTIEDEALKATIMTAIVSSAQDKMSTIPPNPGIRVKITLKPHGNGWSSKIHAFFTRDPRPTENRIVVTEQLTLAFITTSDELDKKNEQQKPKIKPQKQILPNHMVPVEVPQMQATI